VDYAKQCSFQAAANKCVDPLYESEFAGAAAQHTAACDADGADDFRSRQLVGAPSAQFEAIADRAALR
jgi:hypothetical protein